MFWLKQRCTTAATPSGPWALPRMESSESSRVQPVLVAPTVKSALAEITRPQKALEAW